MLMGDINIYSECNSDTIIMISCSVVGYGMVCGILEGRMGMATGAAVAATGSLIVVNGETQGSYGAIYSAMAITA